MFLRNQVRAKLHYTKTAAPASLLAGLAQKALANPAATGAIAGGALGGIGGGLAAKKRGRSLLGGMAKGGLLGAAAGGLAGTAAEYAGASKYFGKDVTNTLTKNVVENILAGKGDAAITANNILREGGAEGLKELWASNRGAMIGAGVGGAAGLTGLGALAGRGRKRDAVASYYGMNPYWFDKTAELLPARPSEAFALRHPYLATGISGLAGAGLGAGLANIYGSNLGAGALGGTLVGLAGAGLGQLYLRRRVRQAEQEALAQAALEADAVASYYGCNPYLAELEYTKQAGKAELLQSILNNPAISGALVGAGTGTAAGGLAGYIADRRKPKSERKGRALRWALAGGALGGAAGGLAGRQVMQKGAGRLAVVKRAQEQAKEAYTRELEELKDIAGKEKGLAATLPDLGVKQLTGSFPPSRVFVFGKYDPVRSGALIGAGTGALGGGVLGAYRGRKDPEGSTLKGALKGSLLGGALGAGTGALSGSLGRKNYLKQARSLDDSRYSYGQALADVKYERGLVDDYLKHHGG